MIFQRCFWPIASAYWRANLRQDFDRFGAARDEEDLVHAIRHVAGNTPSQVLCRPVLEMQPVGEGHLVHLPLHRLKDVTVAVTNIDHHGPARSVDEPVAVLIP